MPIVLVRFTCWIINKLFRNIINSTNTHTQNDVDIIEIGLAYHFNRTFIVAAQCFCWTNNSIVHTHIRIHVHIQTNSTVQKVNKSLFISFSKKIRQPWNHIIWGRFYTQSLQVFWVKFVWYSKFQMRTKSGAKSYLIDFKNNYFSTQFWTFIAHPLWMILFLFFPRDLNIWCKILELVTYHYHIQLIPIGRLAIRRLKLIIPMRQ